MAEAKYPKPTKTHPILAVHEWRENRDGEQLYRLFTQAAWKHLMPVQIPGKPSGKMHNKGGWKEVNPKALETPPEAKASSGKSSSKKS